MFDLALLVTRLETETGYSTKLDEGQEPTGKNRTDPPTIMVGYHTIETGDIVGEDDAVLPYVAYAEELTQVFYTQFSCNIINLPIVWRNIHKAVAGWVPLDTEQGYSGVNPVKDLQKGITNGRAWWICYWKIQIPHVMSEL